MKKTTKTTASKCCAKKKTTTTAAAKTTSATAAKKTAEKATTVKKAAPKAKAPAKKTTTKAASAKKAVKRITRIVANIDIGWGNMLYIRGEGAGLSWEQGVPMLCEDGKQWHWDAETEDGPISFKFLMNDEKWALGENVTINAGDFHSSEPQF